MTVEEKLEAVLIDMGREISDKTPSALADVLQRYSDRVANVLQDLAAVRSANTGDFSRWLDDFLCAEGIGALWHEILVKHEADKQSHTKQKLAEKIEGIRKIGSRGSSVIDVSIIDRYLADEITLDEAINIHSPCDRFIFEKEKTDEKQRGPTTT